MDALGKPETYDPRRDSTVRLQSGKLRQRIVEYYRTAGLSDPVVVDFPKGHFKLTFSRREPAGPAFRGGGSRTGATNSASGLGGSHGDPGGSVPVFARRGRLGRPPGPPRSGLPALDEFWGPFSSRKDMTLVCVGAPLFIHIQEMEFLRNSDVNSWEEAEHTGLLARLKRLFPGGSPQPWHNFTGVGEAGGAFLVGNLLAARGLRLQFANSKQLTWNEIGEHDVVFVGPPKFISQIADLPVVPDFTVEGSGIRNLRPRPGEPAFLEDEYSDASHENGRTHALISRLPGLHGKGAILVLGGTWTGHVGCLSIHHAGSPCARAARTGSGHPPE